MIADARRVRAAARDRSSARASAGSPTRSTDAVTSLRASCRLPAAGRRRPRREARARRARRPAGRLPAGPPAHLRGRRPGRDARSRCARCKPLGAGALLVTNAAGSLRAERRPGLADGDRRPHQHARRQPAHRGQRRRRRPALPEPARRLRPGAARLAARGRRGARHHARRGRLPRHRRARASRPRPRSARSARSAPTPSACRPCPR